MDRSHDVYPEPSPDEFDRPVDDRTDEPSTRSDGLAGEKAGGDKDATTIRYVDGLADLAAIRRPDVELAIWLRCQPSKFSTWLAALQYNQLPDLRVLVTPDAVPETIGKYLNECGMPSGDMRDFLVADVQDLARTFAEISDIDAVDVRLERLQHDACWRYHRDRVDARLLTTYLGPGTEWVDHRDADAAIKQQNDFAGTVTQLRTFDVALFKGTQAGGRGGVVHRSPPIMELGLTRLLLCLNKPSISTPGFEGVQSPSK